MKPLFTYRTAFARIEVIDFSPEYGTIDLRKVDIAGNQVAISFLDRVRVVTEMAMHYLISIRGVE